MISCRHHTYVYIYVFDFPERITFYCESSCFHCTVFFPATTAAMEKLVTFLSQGLFAVSFFSFLPSLSAPLALLLSCVTRIPNVLFPYPTCTSTATPLVWPFPVSFSIFLHIYLFPISFFAFLWYVAYTWGQHIQDALAITMQYEWSQHNQHKKALDGECYV